MSGGRRGEGTSQRGKPRTGQRAPRAAHAWASLRRPRLLDTRLCNLKLRIEDSWLMPRIERMYAELAGCGFRLRPRVWLSDEWFVPADGAGIAAPFYLAHPRLRRLERDMMLEVEGGTDRSCMMLLRHECGHVVQFAYGLHRRKQWRELFGRSTAPYPEAYKPKPYSRRHVLHLDNHYAQAHPDEDFAETFAVWMTPNATWRRRYKGWPALAKLEYVDELMQEIRGTPPKQRSRRAVRPMRELRSTLGEHYQEKQARYGLDQPDVYRRDLRRLFAGAVDNDTRESAATFLRRHRTEMLEIAHRWTGQYHYTISGVYDLMIERSRQMRLRVPDDRTVDSLKLDTAVLVSVQTMIHLQRGGRWVSI